MADNLQEKVNRLLDLLQAGKISMRQFVRRSTKLGVGSNGLGPHIARRQSSALVTDSLIRTGLVVKIDEQEDKTTRVEGTVRPGAVEFDQIVKQRWTLESGGTRLAVSVAGREAVAQPGMAIEIKAGQRVGFRNRGARAIKFVAYQPIWEPKDYSYQYEGQRLTGAEMWFELKTSPSDRTLRPMYNVLSAGGEGNFVMITVEPNTASVRSYYTDDEYVITGMIGTGTVELRSAGKTEAPVLQRGDTVTLSPKDVFRLINNSSETFIVEVRSKSARYWTPESTYFETKKGRFVPGNQIYFEFVIPS